MVNKFFKQVLKPLLVTLLISINALAQDSEIQMADTMRSNGKIYVVLVTVLTVLTGLFLFLIYLEKKISKLENK